MDDTDTATLELTRPEAREVINALSGYHVTATDDAETRALEVRDFLQREFGFKDEHFETNDPVTSAFGDVLGGDGDHEVQFSRPEAEDVVSALADLEADSEPAEAETIADIRARLEDAFDTDADHSR